MINKDLFETDLYGALSFDPIYKKRMVKLLSLMKKSGNKMVRLKMSPYGDILSQDKAYSFLGTSQMIASQLFYLFMKDELSGAEGNKLLEYLCKYISTDSDTKVLNNDEYRSNLEYMAEITRMEFNSVMDAAIYDFYISMYSCFEAAINAMALKYETEIKKNLEDSRIKHFNKLLKNRLFKDDNFDLSSLNLVVDKNREYILKEFPVYVSLSDNINHLFTKLPLDYYSRGIERNPKNDKEFLLFAGALRNTIHNNGIHIHKDKEYELRGKKFILEQYKVGYYENLFDDIYILVDELFDIYCAIFRCFYVEQINEINNSCDTSDQL